MTEDDVRLVVADRLLEPGGLQLGLITDNQFHAYFLDALADFCRSTGIVKLFSTQTVNNGQSRYVFPDRLINVESVFTSGRFVPRSNLNSIDNSQFKWRNKVGPVKAFHEDGLPIKTIEAVPAPDWQGTLVTDPSGYEYLDAFSSPGTIPASERNLTVYGSQIPTGLTVCELDVSGLTLEHTGTVSLTNPAQFHQPQNFHGYSEEQFLLGVTPGQVVTFVLSFDCFSMDLVLFDNPDNFTRYWEYSMSASAPGVEQESFVGTANSHSSQSAGLVGLTARMTVVWTVPAGVTSAILSVCTGPNQWAWPDGFTTTQDPINYALSVNASGLGRTAHCTQMIPDSAIMYLAWACLAKIYSDNSELRDAQKAMYATARYQEGVGLFRAILEKELADDPE